jgi:hypothetical protein
MIRVQLRAAISTAHAPSGVYISPSASHPATRIQQILAIVEPTLIVQPDQMGIRSPKP